MFIFKNYRRCLGAEQATQQVSRQKDQTERRQGDLCHLPHSKVLNLRVSRNWARVGYQNQVQVGTDGRKAYPLASTKVSPGNGGQY